MFNKYIKRNDERTNIDLRQFNIPDNDSISINRTSNHTNKGLDENRNTLKFGLCNTNNVAWAGRSCPVSSSCDTSPAKTSRGLSKSRDRFQRLSSCSTRPYSAARPNSTERPNSSISPSSMPYPGRATLSCSPPPVYCTTPEQSYDNCIPIQPKRRFRDYRSPCAPVALMPESSRRLAHTPLSGFRNSFKRYGSASEFIKSIDSINGHRSGFRREKEAFSDRLNTMLQKYGIGDFDADPRKKDAPISPVKENESENPDEDLTKKDKSTNRSRSFVKENEFDYSDEDLTKKDKSSHRSRPYIKENEFDYSAEDLTKKDKSTNRSRSYVKEHEFDYSDEGLTKKDKSTNRSRYNVRENVSDDSNVDITKKDKPIRSNGSYFKENESNDYDSVVELKKIDSCAHVKENESDDSFLDLVKKYTPSAYTKESVSDDSYLDLTKKNTSANKSYVKESESMDSDSVVDVKKMNTSSAYIKENESDDSTKDLMEKYTSSAFMKENEPGDSNIDLKKKYTSSPLVKENESDDYLVDSKKKDTSSGYAQENASGDSVVHRKKKHGKKQVHDINKDKQLYAGDIGKYYVDTDKIEVESLRQQYEKEVAHLKEQLQFNSMDIPCDEKDHDELKTRVRERLDHEHKEDFDCIIQQLTKRFTEQMKQQQLRFEHDKNLEMLAMKVSLQAIQNGVLSLEKENLAITQANSKKSINDLDHVFSQTKLSPRSVSKQVSEEGMVNKRFSGLVLSPNEASNEKLNLEDPNNTQDSRYHTLPIKKKTSASSLGDTKWSYSDLLKSIQSFSKTSLKSSQNVLKTSMHSEGKQGIANRPSVDDVTKRMMNAEGEPILSKGSQDQLNLLSKEMSLNYGTPTKATSEERTMPTEEMAFEKKNIKKISVATTDTSSDDPRDSNDSFLNDNFFLLFVLAPIIVALLAYILYSMFLYIWPPTPPPPPPKGKCNSWLPFVCLID